MVDGREWRDVAPRTGGASRRTSDGACGPTIALYGIRFCDTDLEGAKAYLRNRRADDAFAYVVTPNVDHVVRVAHGGEAALSPYRAADLCLCDSRVLGSLAKLSGVRLPVVPGSDLVRALFEEGVVDPSEPVAVVGMTDAAVTRLARRYDLRRVLHHNPPMDFIRRPEAVRAAVEFIERSAARFIFIAVGSPQQERLAEVVSLRGRASGVALCVGASLLFLTGDVRRAPRWLQRMRLEWLFRLLSEPRRLWRRYLLDGPRIFGLVLQDVLECRSRAWAQRRAENDPSALGRG